MASLLQLDEQLTPRVRVRRWEHAGQALPQWPAGAHATVEIAWVEQGSALYDVHGECLEVPAGGAVIIPAGMEHRTRIQHATRATSAWLAPEVLDQVADALAVPRQACMKPNVLHHAPSVAAVGGMLLGEAHNQDVGRFLSSDALAEVLAVKFLSTCTREPPTAGRRDPRITRAVDLIEQSYAEPLTLEALARAASMSRFHFSRLFHQQVGMSPHQYLLQRRIKQAARLLRSGEHNVTEAAMRVGFADLGRFGRMFKKVTGSAPSQYRKHSS